MMKERCESAAFFVYAYAWISLNLMLDDRVYHLQN